MNAPQAPTKKRRRHQPRRPAASARAGQAATVLTILTVLTEKFTPSQTACRAVSQKQGVYKLRVQGIQIEGARDTN